MVEVVVRRHSANASMKVLPGKVLSVRLSGPLTGPAIKAFAVDAESRFGSSVRGFLLDYRGGIILTSAEGLGVLFRAAPPQSPLRRPVAFVCTDGQEQIMRSHAFAMAQSGFLRRVFDEADRAHVWLVREIERRRRG